MTYRPLFSPMLILCLALGCVCGCAHHPSPASTGADELAERTERDDQASASIVPGNPSRDQPKKAQVTENLSPDAESTVEPEVVEAQVSFTAKIVQLVPLSRYTGTVTPVHFDPRFVLVLEIERVEEGGAEALEPGRRAFAIHSPSRLLGDDAKRPVGRRIERGKAELVKQGA